MYKTYKSLDLIEINKNTNIDFNSDYKNRTSNFTCYDGPPSVSGLPGIHHILSRTLKDIFCRYHYLKGNSIYNKSGWDTHGLPVELKVEKNLNITKKDIGTKISVKDYNNECHKSVNEYTDKWKELTKIHGYCTDIDNPYITCDQKYIESEWWAFKKLYDNGYIYQDYSIQPYSPMAGTGLSSHELNQPGCYRNIKDLTVTVMFKSISEKNTYFLAWTTTPWTLPANSALAVNKNIDYVKVNCINKYSKENINVILSKSALKRYFNDESEYKIIKLYNGNNLIGLKYEQLFTFIKPQSKNSIFNIFNFFKKKQKSFEIINADYVTDTDGTGIVHIAPSFGVDDRRVAKENNIIEITVKRNGKDVPIVNEEGKYVDEITKWKGVYVKKEYYLNPDKAIDVNVEIIKDLKERKLCFNTEKHEHSYPHCWRTDKPLIYYPLKTWFIKTTAIKDKLVEFNNKINWHPKSTGDGRFKNWLENIVDWNVSRNRFWGVPIPIWISEDGDEIKCIGSYEELKNEIEKANKILNLNQKTTLDDIHKPYIDEIILVSENNKKLKRVPEVMDVWFDSGAMPFAQYHYPFENKDEFLKHYPADFICEGVDQTRGWFYTLHVLSVILFDNIAYKNVVSNGLVLDKNGNKMSKRLGNTVDPFELFDKYGSDAVRFYMIINSDPWDNLKFDVEGVEEVSRRFFSTLFNTYNFFALYYNSNEEALKNITIDLKKVELKDIDKWILSRLNSAIKDVESELDNYNPTKALRIINDFVIDDLSNWYVRLNRKRFSRNEDITDCCLVFTILKECIDKISILIYPFTPFFSKWLNKNINNNN